MYQCVFTFSFVAATAVFTPTQEQKLRTKIELQNRTSKQAQMIIKSNLTAALASIDKMKEREQTMMNEMSEMRTDMKALKTQANLKLVDVEESKAIRLQAEADATAIRYEEFGMVVCGVVGVAMCACMYVCVCVCVCVRLCVCGRGGGGGMVISSCVWFTLSSGTPPKCQLQKSCSSIRHACKHAGGLWKCKRARHCLHSVHYRCSQFCMRAAIVILINQGDCKKCIRQPEAGASK